MYSEDSLGIWWAIVSVVTATSIVTGLDGDMIYEVGSLLRLGGYRVCCRIGEACSNGMTSGWNLKQPAAANKPPETHRLPVSVRKALFANHTPKKCLV